MLREVGRVDGNSFHVLTLSCLFIIHELVVECQVVKRVSIVEVVREMGGKYCNCL